MAKVVEYTAWPLPEPLTRKVVGYLNIYRMVIAVLLHAWSRTLVDPTSRHLPCR